MEKTLRKQWRPNLIEVLLVVSILAVLTALLMPVMSDRGSHEPRVRMVVVEMADLKAAISEYYSEYVVLPAVSNMDTTFGYNASLLPNAVPTNSSVMVILLDEDRYVNVNHARNPRHTVFFTAKRNTDDTKPGISIDDCQFRDPWGNPYIITMDLNGDGKCYDAFYRRHSVSQKSTGSAEGYNGLQSDTNNPNSDNYYLKGDVMIWSLGPDGKADPNLPANVGVNKDNVLSWQ